MGLHSEAGLDKKFIEFAKMMNVYLNNFPRYERYGLALEIRRAAYEMYGMIVECQKRYHKKTTLTSLDIRHQQLRMLIRLAHQLGYFGRKEGGSNDKTRGDKRYLVLSSLVDELGRMVGGWIVADREKSNNREIS